VDVARNALFLIIIGLLLSVACGDDDADLTTGLSGDITVFAAASLTAAFEAIGDDFTAANPGTGVEFNFAGSQDLRTQLEQGARADVFASADTKQMDMARESGVVAIEATTFVHNRLVVIVPKTNEAGIETLQDLANPGLKIVLASAEVPVGNYSRQYLDKASADPAFEASYGDAVLANVVSEESNVKQVVSRIQLDEADAGIVYSSDVTAEVAADVTTIEIPDALNQIANYPIAVTADAGNAEVAQAFIAYVLSDAGQAVLEEQGFIPVD
jgi:molybdate transport system substrate-binding protein